MEEKITMTAPNGMVITTTAKDTERWSNHFFKVGQSAREKREANEAARNQRYYDKFKGKPEKEEPSET